MSRKASNSPSSMSLFLITSTHTRSIRVQMTTIQPSFTFRAKLRQRRPDRWLATSSTTRSSSPRRPSWNTPSRSSSTNCQRLWLHWQYINLYDRKLIKRIFAKSYKDLRPLTTLPGIIGSTPWRSTVSREHLCSQPTRWSLMGPKDMAIKTGPISSRNIPNDSWKSVVVSVFEG